MGAWLRETALPVLSLWVFCALVLCAALIRAGVA